MAASGNAGDVMSSALRHADRPTLMREMDTLLATTRMLQRIVAVLASLLAFGGCLARPVPDALEGACRARLGARLGTWTLASASPEVAAWTRSRDFDPTMARGDFDGDGRIDIALLVQARATPVFPYPERIEASRVAVCLDREAGIELHVIEALYCADYIELAVKGAVYHDIERQREDAYPSDGVRTVCFKKASATYVYDGAGFRRIVDGD